MVARLFGFCACVGCVLRVAGYNVYILLISMLMYMFQYFWNAAGLAQTSLFIGHASLRKQSVIELL